jgi:hypothetical protein
VDLRQGVFYQYNKAEMDEHIIPVSGGFTRHFSGGPVRSLSGETDPINLHDMISGT